MGELTLIIGPMFSGKSTELKRLYRRAQIAGRKVLMINALLNTRDSVGGQVVKTHDGDHVDALSVACIGDISIRKEASGVTDFFIDEGQFFPDLNVIHYLLGTGANVYLAALDSDYTTKPFKDVVSLVPRATKVSKLNAICCSCGKDNAIYSVRLTSSRDTIDIGGSDKYKAACAKCRDEVLMAALKATLK